MLPHPSAAGASTKKTRRRRRDVLCRLRRGRALLVVDAVPTDLPRRLRAAMKTPSTRLDAVRSGAVFGDRRERTRGTKDLRRRDRGPHNKCVRQPRRHRGDGLLSSTEQQDYHAMQHQRRPKPRTPRSPLSKPRAQASRRRRPVSPRRSRRGRRPLNRPRAPRARRTGPSQHLTSAAPCRRRAPRTRHRGRSVFTASVATMASNNGTSRRSLCSEAATAAVVTPGAGSAWMDARVRCAASLTCVVSRVDGVAGDSHEPPEAARRWRGGGADPTSTPSPRSAPSRRRHSDAGPSPAANSSRRAPRPSRSITKCASS